jgi:hypothetical protein
MGWTCISSSCETGTNNGIDTCCVDASGLWNGQGVAYFSISDQILFMHNAVLSYLMNMTPITLLLYVAIICIMLIVLVFVGVARGVRNF